MLRHVAEHDRTGTDSAVLANCDIAENLCSAADHDVVLKSGMAFALFLAGATESPSLIKRDIISNDRSLADDDTHPVIDEETAADLRAGMDFNTSQQARDLRKPPGEQEHPMIPEPVIDSVK